MRVLLDTHALLELVENGTKRFSHATQVVVENVETELLLSSVSVTEIAVKNTIGKLLFGWKSVETAVEDLQLKAIGFEQRHAAKLFSLPLHHRDPFDRMLIATALVEDVPLLSRDEAFKKYRGLRLLR